MFFIRGGLGPKGLGKNGGGKNDKYLKVKCLYYIAWENFPGDFAKSHQMWVQNPLYEVIVWQTKIGQ
jgi:hypothetical protein